MRKIDLPPRAASIAESLRDLGYTLETAVSDIIDNSITANASQIKVFCIPSGIDTSLAIIDNGIGMDETELIEAMRYGSKSPKESRSINDLGRFGLGLKTASFSQCRKLTVVSVKDHQVSGLQWNLDDFESSNWAASVLDPSECGVVPWFDELGDVGTIIVWENLDRLTERHSGDRLSEHINEKILDLTNHISLVYHRFLKGELGPKRKISIKINGHLISGFDPFCRSNPATIPQPRESILIDGQEIEIRPYILPHHSKLTKTEYNFYKNRSDFLSNQGVYIYRNGRLMAWADWFRLVPKGEATKLARVQIDFPSSLDEEWTIDIKKSRAHPPSQVREKLRQIIGKITSQSTVVHSGRARKLFEKDAFPVWSRIPTRGILSYTPNEEHPIITGFESGLSPTQLEKFKAVLTLIGTAIPFEAIYSDFANNPKDLVPEFDEVELAQVSARLAEIREIVDPDKAFDKAKFRKIVISTRILEGAESYLDDFIDREF